MNTAKDPKSDIITDRCQHCRRMVGHYTHATEIGGNWWHKSCEKWTDEATERAYAYALARHVEKQ